MNKQTTIFILLFLVLCSFCYAAPPAKFISASDSGYVIESPIYDSIAVNNEFDFNIHLFNASNGVPIDNTSVICVLHIYNQSGDHVFGSIMSHDLSTEHFVSNEWVSRLNSSVFKSRGEYNSVVQCNSSTNNRGGYSKQNFGVMNNIFDVSNDNTAGISITLFILMITLGLFYMGFTDYRFMNMEWADLLLKRCSIIIAIWFVMYNASIITSLSLSSNLNMTGNLFAYMTWFGWAGYIATAYLIVKTLFDTMALWRIKKQKEREGEYD